MKPSDRTPLSAVLLGEILSQAGLPEGAFSILPCEHDDAHIFSTDPNISTYDDSLSLSLSPLHFQNFVFVCFYLSFAKNKNNNN